VKDKKNRRPVWVYCSGGRGAVDRRTVLTSTEAVTGGKKEGRAGSGEGIRSESPKKKNKNT